MININIFIVLRNLLVMSTDFAHRAEYSGDARPSVRRAVLLVPASRFTHSGNSFIWSPGANGPAVESHRSGRPKPALIDYLALQSADLTHDSHMCLDRAVLTRKSMQAPAEGNAVLVEKHLHRIFGNPYIYPLPNIFVRYGILHFIYQDVVVVLDCGYFPPRQLKWGSR